MVRLINGYSARPFGSSSLAIVLAVLLLVGCRPAADRPAAPSRADAPTAPERIVTKLGIEMVRIPGGEFVMGDEDGEEDEKPAHRVQFSSFAMDVYEVTQERYQKMMGRNPAKFSGPGHPVERVSWLSAARYCNMRSLREGLTSCYDPETLECDFSADGYRLPTEAEWEYACRAGAVASWSFGNNPRDLEKHAWFRDNSAKTTHPVGRKASNPWGLYDMHGNVAEWCNDRMSETYDSSGDVSDPRGPASGEERVLRGGSWRSTAQACRSAARDSETPRFADACFGSEAYGFRCVRRMGPEGADEEKR